MNRNIDKIPILGLVTILTFSITCGCGSNRSTKAANSISSEKDSSLQINQDSIIQTKDSIKGRADTIYNSVFYDIDDDGKKDKVIVFRLNDSIYLEMNSGPPINLNTESLNLIQTKNGKPTPVLFCDFHQDKKVEIMISAADSIVGDQSFVKIFTYQNSSLRQEKFYYSDLNFFDYLIAKENFIAVDTISGNIYCCTNTVVSDSTDSGIMYKIDNYAWDQNRGKIFLKASKEYDENIFKRPQKVFNK